MFLVLLLAVALGALAQTITGFGFALLCGPLLIATLGQPAAVRLILLLSSIISVVLLVRDVRHVRLADGLLLLAPGVVVTPAFAWALQRLDTHMVTIAAGVVTLLSAGALASGLRLSWLRGRRGATGAGALGAAMNVIGGLSGPAVALYSVNARWPAEAVRPTLQVYGLGLNSIALATLGLPALTPAPFVGLLLGWGAGSLLGRGVPAGARLSPAHLRRGILVLAALGGLLAVVQGLRS